MYIVFCVHLGYSTWTSDGIAGWQVSCLTYNICHVLKQFLHMSV